MPTVFWASQVALMVKNLPANAEDIRDSGSISLSGKPSGVGNGNPCQYSCLGKPMDRGTWRDIVHGTTKNWTRLSVSEFSFFSLLFAVYDIVETTRSFTQGQTR